MSEAKPHIVSLASYMPTVEKWLDDAYTVHRVWQAKDRETEIDKLREAARGIAAMGHSRVDGALLDRLPHAKIVSLSSVGYDAIDVAAARARGVAVTNTPDVLTDDVADLALALIVAVARRIVVGDRYVRSGRWAKDGNMALATNLRGKTAAILGLGRIGGAIARRAEVCGMKIVYGGRTKRDVPWPYIADTVELARQADFLVVAVPGGDATKHMVDAKVIEALGPEGFLVNIARGSVVDEPALISALQDGTIMAAGLDVFAKEPAVPAELLAMENVVLLPHVGSASVFTREKMDQLIVDNILAWAAGRPPLTPVPETPWRSWNKG